MRKLLRAGADPDISSEYHGTARKNAELNGSVEVVVAIDEHRCRNLLLELCIGMFAADFPVLVVLKIHDALCNVCSLHEAEMGEVVPEWQLLSEGHVKGSVAWEIAKAVKHFFD